MKYVVLVDGEAVEVEVDGGRVTVFGRTQEASLGVIPGTPLRQLLLGGTPSTFSMAPLGRGRWGLTQGGDRVELEVMDQRAHHIRSLTSGNGQRKSADVLKAPMPGLVIRVQVKPGDQVAPGAGLVALEAMKMELTVLAPAAGVIAAVLVSEGELVAAGQRLIEVEE